MIDDNKKCPCGNVGLYIISSVNQTPVKEGHCWFCPSCMKLIKPTPKSSKEGYKWPYEGEELVICSGPDCSTEIYFRTTKIGKKIPINYETREPHFIDCVNVSRFRKK